MKEEDFVHVKKKHYVHNPVHPVPFAEKQNWNLPLLPPEYLQRRFPRQL
jgi:hypothetical protein